MKGHEINDLLDAFDSPIKTKQPISINYPATSSNSSKGFDRIEALARASPKGDKSNKNKQPISINYPAISYIKPPISINSPATSSVSSKGFDRRPKGNKSNEQNEFPIWSGYNLDNMRTRPISINSPTKSARQIPFISPAKPPIKNEHKPPISINSTAKPPIWSANNFDNIREKPHVKINFDNLEEENRLLKSSDNQLIKQLQEEINKLREENRSLKARNSLIKASEYTINRKQREIDNQWRLIKQQQEELKIARESFIKERDAEINRVQTFINNEYQKFEAFKIQAKKEIQQLEAELQKKADEATYNHQIMSNKINVNRERPELKYREEYPEYYQTQIMAMKQQERHNREMNHIKNEQELKRLKFDEKRKTEKFINQERIKAIKVSREQLYGISRIKHQGHPEAPAIINDVINSHTYYLFDIINDDSAIEGNFENDRYYIKIQKFNLNLFIYIYPKY